MKTKDALKYFNGNQSALARAAGVKPHTVYDWGTYPPYMRQCLLEQATKRKLRAEPLPK